jgi:tRNA modification GTPase
MQNQSPTIVAQASGSGRGGVAVVRLSGAQADAAFRSICVPPDLSAPRMAVLRELHDPRDGALIDRALVIRFPAPASFTGEDVIEFHVHGGRSVIKDLLEGLCSLPNIELAAAGAFSRRAFENGKLDLTEAEAIADLVDAETAAQRKQALRQMDGELGRLYKGWADRLTHLLALSEAEIDFADEEDIPAEITKDRAEELNKLSQEIDAHLADNHRGERLREGFMVALLGAPNAGKSSLLNALARREAAIVAPTPGTTRDIVEVQLDLGGYPVTLADTAGLRAAADDIESEGVRRALDRAGHADFKILLFDGSLEEGPDAETRALADEAALVVVNKIDKMSAPQQAALNPFFAGALFVSAKEGTGIAKLSARLIEEIDRRYVGSTPALTRLRHRQALEDCRSHLSRASSVRQSELCAEDLRLASRSLGQITGHVGVEDLLDKIFSTFCIGK